MVQRRMLRGRRVAIKEGEQQATNVSKPQVVFNHLYMVLEEKAFHTLRNSEFATRQFAASDQGFPKFKPIDNACQSIYLRGKDTYLEMLGPNNSFGAAVGSIGLAWCVETKGARLARHHRSGTKANPQMSMKPRLRGLRLNCKQIAVRVFGHYARRASRSYIIGISKRGSKFGSKQGNAMHAKLPVTVLSGFLAVRRSGRKVTRQSQSGLSVQLAIRDS